MSNKGEQIIKEVISFMALNDPFNYMFLMKMDRQPSKSCPTMGVHVKDARMFLEYNLEFMSTLTTPEVRYVLAHEVGHVSLHHCTHRKSNDPKRHKLENLARDLAINCLLPKDSADMRMPVHKEDVTLTDPQTGKSTVVVKQGEKIGVLPSDYGFEDYLSFEQYLDLLDKKAESDPKFLKEMMDAQGNTIVVVQNGDGTYSIGEFDGHGGFKESPELDASIRAAIEAITKKGHGWGNIGGKYEEAVKKAQSSEVAWWRLLRYRLGMFIHSSREPNPRRPHKKHGYPFCGSTAAFVGAVHAYGDTSASVDSKTLGVFLGELERLCEVMPVYWNMFDTAIQLKEPVLFDNQRISQMKILGRGGTNFQAVIDDAEKRRARFVVILTDGECSVPEVKDKSMQIIWVICPGGKAPAGLPGKIIHMKKVY